MLKLPYQKSRSSHEGDLKTNFLYLATARYRKLKTKLSNKLCMRFGGRKIQVIPVLSIFVLLGIIGFSTIGLPLAEPDGEVYAADSASNTSSLIIDNGDLTQSNNTTTEGNVTYSSHTVQVSASNINGYSLKITGPTNLTGSTTITGAGNKTPANMANNTWGYAWGSTSTANTSLSYNSFTGSDQTLASNSSATSANFTNKLVFAVKFGDNAASGHYRANVKLNLTVTPKTVTSYNYSVTYNANGGSGTVPTVQTVSSSDSETSHTFIVSDQGNLARSGYNFLGWGNTASNPSTIYTAGSTITLPSSGSSVTLYAIWTLRLDSLTYMQEITDVICRGAKIGDTATLKDSRDSKPYTIQKLTDGNCWMTQNLALDLNKAGAAPAATSDTTSDYPASAMPVSGTFSSTRNTQQWTSASTSTGYKDDYGYYYSWCAATAGDCSIGARSICPKGWKLPVGGYTIAKNTSSSQNGNDFANLAGVNSYERFSYSSATVNGINVISLGGAYWPLAGYISYRSIESAGSYARYWSRNSSGSGSAFNLAYDSGKLFPGDYESSYYGFPVRCVAYSS